MPLLDDDELARRAAEIEWLLLDVDGVLTDGGLYYDAWGQGLLRFHVRDGLAIKMARDAGLKVGVLSGRSSPALERRAAELSIDEYMTGIDDKRAALDSFLERHDVAARRVAYVGDDLQDLAVLAICGLAFAPSDAVAEVRTVAHRVLEARGGKGAVREAVELLLRARGDWRAAVAPYTFEG